MPEYLFIGVTGHRDIPYEDFGQLKTEVREYLLGLIAKNTDHSICILSGLAEGADLLVVEVAIDLAVPFIAVLPMQTDEYLDDFSDQASVSQFKTLLVQAMFVEVLQASTLENKVIRDDCYQQLAVYLAEKSDGLIALWDGDIAEKVGGTSQVVRLFKEANPQQPNRFKHIQTRRLSHLNR